jgi:hypothetical protein
MYLDDCMHVFHKQNFLQLQDVGNVFQPGNFNDEVQAEIHSSAGRMHV